MSFSGESLQHPTLPELYRPSVLAHSLARVQVLLRRAQEHQQAMDDQVSQLPSLASKKEAAEWASMHRTLMQNRLARLEVCLIQLKAYVRHHPESSIKGEVEMLHTKWQFFGRLLPRDSSDGK